jgi:hypothetical protein
MLSSLKHVWPERVSFMLLIFNILASSVSCAFVTYTPNKAPIALKLASPQLPPQFRKILKYLAGRQ